MQRIWAGSIVAGAAILSLTGCGMKGGAVGVHPTVTKPTEAATITIFRDGAIPGWFATIQVELDGREIYRVARNESYSFQIDPGQYLMIHRIGFNECRQVIWAQPRQSYRVRLSPDCTI